MRRLTNTIASSVDEMVQLRIVQVVIPNLLVLFVWGLSSIVVYACVSARGLMERDLDVTLLWTSSLSLIGSSLTLASSLLVSQQKKPAFHLVYCNALADIGYAMKFWLTSVLMLSGDDSIITTGHPFCWLTAGMSQFFGMATMSWSFILSLNMFLMVAVPMKYGRSQQKYFKYYHAYVWAYSTMSFLVPAAFGEVGYNPDGSCWVLGYYALLFYVPLYMYWIFSGFSIVYVSYTLLRKDESSPFMTAVVTRSMLLTTVFFLSWLWGAVYRIVLITNNGEAPDWLTCVHVFYLGFGGFLNFLCWFPYVLQTYTKMRRDSEYVVVSVDRRTRTPALDFTEPMLPSSTCNSRMSNEPVSNDGVIAHVQRKRWELNIVVYSVSPSSLNCFAKQEIANPFISTPERTLDRLASEEYTIRLPRSWQSNTLLLEPSM